MKIIGEDVDLEQLVLGVPERVVFQDVGGEMVLLNIESGEYYGLNEVGSKTWVLSQEGHSLNEILRRLLSEYNVSAERLRSDMVQFLRQLQLNGIVDIDEHTFS